MSQADLALVVKESMARVSARVERTNRLMYLAGLLTPAELEGAIALLEAAHRCRRVLEGVDAATADRGLAFMAFDGSF